MWLSEMNNLSIETGVTECNRRPFFIVLGLFFLPLVLAFAVYYGSNWRPSGTTNKGDLINPAISLPLVKLLTSEGEITNDRFLRGDWSLVYLGDGSCDQPCRDALFSMRQAFQLLGKDMTRIKRVFLYAGNITDPAFFLAQHTDLMKVNIDAAAGHQLLEVFPDDKGVPALKSGKIYIVDPLGNLMMAYIPDTDPRNIYQDLKKLLSLSHIG